MKEWLDRDEKKMEWRKWRKWRKRRKSEKEEDMEKKTAAEMEKRRQTDAREGYHKRCGVWYVVCGMWCVVHPLCFTCGCE